MRFECSSPGLPTHWKHLIATPSGEVQHVRREDGTGNTFYLPSDHLGSVHLAPWIHRPRDARQCRTHSHEWAGVRPSDRAIHERRSLHRPDDGNARLNRYSYVGNRPLSYVDPTGFQAKEGDCKDKSPDECEREREEATDKRDERCKRSANCAAGEPRDGIVRNHPTQLPIDRGGGDTIESSRTIASSIKGARDVSSQMSVVSTVSRFGNDGLMNPIYLPPGTVAMNLPNYVYQQCAMVMCHGNVALPFEKGYMDDEESRKLSIEAGMFILTMPLGGSGGLIPWSSRAVRLAAEALQLGATEVRVGSRAEAAELFLGRYQGAGYRNTTGWSPREVKDFFGAKSGTYHWDEGASAFPHDASHLQIHTLEGPVIRIYFPD